MLHRVHVSQHGVTRVDHGGMPQADALVPAAEARAPIVAATPTTLLPAAYWTPLAALHKWRRNPRKNDKAVPQVARSIRKYGFVAPVVVWQSRDRLVAGHTRLQAMEKLLADDPNFVPRDAPGVGLVPVRFHEFLDEAEADAYALADNKLNEIATWDDGALAEILRDLRSTDEKLLAETGFSDNEIRSLLAGDAGGSGRDREKDNAAADLERANALQAKWQTAPGQLWRIPSRSLRNKEHLLLCGDSRETAHVARLMAGSRAHLLVWDPPFNVGFNYSGAYQGEDEKSASESRRRRDFGLTPQASEHLLDGTPVEAAAIVADEERLRRTTRAQAISLALVAP